MQIVPGGRGDFIVTCDGRELWNKREMGNQFPEHEVVLARLQA